MVSPFWSLFGRDFGWPSDWRFGKRLAQVAELSGDLPETEFVIGAPEFRPSGTIYNSLFCAKSGLVRVLERKRLITPREESVFTTAPESVESPSAVRNLICADLASHRPNSETSIQASCCWATPLLDRCSYYTPPPDEERYAHAMKYAINKLAFQSNVQDIFVVDRTPSTTDIAPLNCYARRRK